MKVVQRENVRSSAKRAPWFSSSIANVAIAMLHGLFQARHSHHHTPSTRKVLGGVFVVLMATCLFSILNPAATSAATGTEQEMSFEGKIVTSAGLNLPDGNYNMEFKIYTGCTNEPTSNTGCTAVWTEDYLTSNSTYATTTPVAFTSGTYAVNLGSICAFTTSSCEGNSNTAINWDTYPLYLSLNIGTTAICATSFSSCGAGDGAMNPYVLLTSTPYAMNAANANAVGGDSLAMLGVLAANNTWTGTNVIQDTASSAFAVENTGGSSVTLNVNTTSGYVSIDKSTASYALDVSGDTNTSGVYRIGGATELQSVAGTTSANSRYRAGG